MDHKVYLCGYLEAEMFEDIFDRIKNVIQSGRDLSNCIMMNAVSGFIC